MNSPNSLIELIRVFTDILTSLMPVVGGLALLAFFWGLVKFLSKAGDAKTHEEGRNLMVWGLIALFVMVSFLGVLYFFYDDFGFNTVRPFGLPTLPNPTAR